MLEERGVRRSAGSSLKIMFGKDEEDAKNCYRN